MKNNLASTLSLQFSSNRAIVLFWLALLFWVPRRTQLGMFLTPQWEFPKPLDPKSRPQAHGLWLLTCWQESVSTDAHR
jgi:hypothetical protein